MTTKEQRIYQKVMHWRSLPEARRREILHKNAVYQVIGSMAMEGEPVSEQWIQQNLR